MGILPAFRKYLVIPCKISVLDFPAAGTLHPQARLRKFLDSSGMRESARREGSLPPTLTLLHHARKSWIFDDSGPAKTHGKTVRLGSLYSHGLQSRRLEGNIINVKLVGSSGAFADSLLMDVWGNISRPQLRTSWRRGAGPVRTR